MANCTVNLFGPVEHGHVLVVAGKTLSECNNFKVNFTSENEEQIALTIFVNVRLKEIVMNTFLDSSWRESVKFEISTLKPGERFKIYILVLDDKLHIAFNDNHLCKYPLNTKLVDIRCVKVTGELEKVTQIDHRRIFPNSWPPVFEDLKSTAFSSDVPYQFSPGSVIVIRMQVSGSPDGSFFIRLNERGTQRQLFHFNPRFADKVVVVNCMNDSLQ
jgi:Galactoside-binding lectin